VSSVYAAVRVLAHCFSIDCILDCGNAVKADGSCYAESNAAGYVQFTDLALMNEDPGSYILDFTLDDGTSPTENTYSGYIIILELGLSRLQDDNYGIHPTFMPEPDRTFVAGELAITDVMVELKNAAGVLADLTRVHVYAELVDVSSTTPPPEMTNAPPVSNGLEAAVVDSTCFNMLNCNEMPAPGNRSCCEEERPECSLCQVPIDGIVRFTFKFKRRGTFYVHFKAQTNMLHEFLSLDDVMIVRANEVRSMFITVQPADFYIGTSKGDELAVLTPQPQLFFADMYGNPTAFPRAGARDAVWAQLCYDRDLRNLAVSPILPSLRHAF
jgi:hypothetical protein